MGFIVQPQTFLAVGLSRSFGTSSQIFSGYVTVNENTTDSLEITQQPVQQGASIADHAFKKPTTFSCQLRFSASVLPGLSLTQGITAPQSLSSIYQKLLTLQNSNVPLNCTTPKRPYKNMLIQSLGVTTDKTTENVLAINITFQQIITVPFKVGNVSPSQLQNAASNAGTNQAGQKASFLAQGAGAVGGLFAHSAVGGL